MAACMEQNQHNKLVTKCNWSNTNVEFLVCIHTPKEGTGRPLQGPGIIWFAIA